MPKENTKGKKEIHKDNLETLAFYRNFALIGTVIQVVHLCLFYFLSSSFSTWNYVFLLFSLAVHGAAYKGLEKLAQPFLGPNGELLECGTDLSKSYFSEYAIDVIILTTGLQGLSALSNYFWLLWAAAPAYVVYKVWVTFLWPWFTSGPSGEEESGSGGKKEGKKPRHKYRQAR
ncbi:transmembrane protein 208-like [Halichondria panicea]|uniref:transmembrane protein 208-like n=1 Tax=Halichondria panicea TaxID=6063 RepID=UPI00312B5D3B